MPWHVGSSDRCPVSRPFAVLKDETGDLEGCHPTADAAERQVAALYASESDAAAGKAAAALGGALKATILDDDAVRLLAIPFGGPIPSPHSPRGVDLDGEWFSERTDIRPAWLKSRAVDWHHGADELFRREVIGKAVDPQMVEGEGWWVTLWLDHGNRRLELIRKLADRGAQIFGSSESVAGMVERDRKTGEILAWPYWRQTLSTSPQNTRSVLRPIKAVLESTDLADTTPSFWRDIGPRLEHLAADLRATSSSGTGASAAKARELLDALSRIEADTDRAIRATRGER